MTRARLPVPVRGLLDERLRKSDVQRLWGGLSAKRARPARALRRGWRWGFSLAIAGIVIVVASVLWLHNPRTSALHLADGHDVPPRIDARGPESAFDDGSSVGFTAGARLDLLESTGHAFTVALRGGRAEFEVHPGGPRVWRVECGPVTVEVVGTHFTVTRDDVKVTIAVQRGAVLVRGEPVPDRVVRVGAHQSIVVPLQHPEPTPTMEEPPDATAPAAVDSGAHSSRSAKGTSVAAPAPSAEQPVSVEKAAPPTLPALLGQADDARLSGRYLDAAAILERAVGENRGAANVGLAEFSLGRLYLDSIGDPARAAVHLSRATNHGLPEALAEDAYARLVEANARAGNITAAHEVAERYRLRYPRGRRLHDVNRWSPPAP